MPFIIRNIELLLCLSYKVKMTLHILISKLLKIVSHQQVHLTKVIQMIYLMMILNFKDSIFMDLMMNMKKIVMKDLLSALLRENLKN